MRGNIPREKMSKAQKQALDQQRRVTWGFSPTARTVESKKHYDRKQKRPWQREHDPQSMAV